MNYLCEDHSDEMVDIDVNGNKKAHYTGRTLLLDADTLAFTTALGLQVEDEVLPKEFYTEEEYKQITSNPTYNEERGTIFLLNLEEAYRVFLERLDEIVKITGCKDYELHFTGGRNFRYEVSKEYKANRSKSYPPAKLKELKELIASRCNAYVHTDIEADDAVIAKKMYDPEGYTLSSGDKDVLLTLATTPDNKHFNYYKREGVTRLNKALDDIPMTWVTVTPEEALKWRYKQCLMGDKTDNIQGIKGIGKVKADKILEGCKTDEECWERVVAAYIKAGLKEEDAIITMQLVDMRQVSYDGTNYNLKLFKETDEMSDEFDFVVEERGKDYGDYAGGTKLRTDIMDIIRARHKDVRGVDLGTEAFINILDVVNKLSRIAASPEHRDSWLDLSNYAKLVTEGLPNDN